MSRMQKIKNDNHFCCEPFCCPSELIKKAWAYIFELIYCHQFYHLLIYLMYQYSTLRLELRLFIKIAPGSCNPIFHVSNQSSNYTRLRSTVYKSSWIGRNKPFCFGLTRNKISIEGGSFHKNYTITKGLNN